MNIESNIGQIEIDQDKFKKMSINVQAILLREEIQVHQE